MVAGAFFACSQTKPPSASSDGPSTDSTTSTKIDAATEPTTCDAGTTSTGDCVKACDPGKVQCGADCTDLASDTMNCGACGQRCGALQVCYGGVCSAGCASGSVACGGQCVEPNRDPTHCGATAGCGEDGGIPGKACGAGETCLGSQCLGDCTGNTTACNGTCTDTTTDAQNCGSCDHACAPGETCTAMTCCSAGMTACMGSCYDLITDSNACGSCANKCDDGQACINGSCQ